MKIRPFYRAGLLAAFLLSFAINPLRADLPPDAQQSLNNGINAFTQKNYPLAIQYFQDARTKAPNAPEIYFKLGVAESQIPGRELRAICWLEAYMAATPDAPNAAKVNDQIKSLDARSHDTLSKLGSLLPGMTNLVVTIQDAYSRNYGLQNIANFQVEIGDVAGANETLTSARKIIAQIRDAEKKDLALYGMADMQASAGDIAGARKTVRRVKDLTSKILDLNSIAQAQIEAGDIAGAKETLVTALKTANQIQDANSKNSEQGGIAATQAKAGDIAGAQNTADSIQNAYWKGEAQEAIAEAQAKAGDIAGAQNTAGAIQDGHWKSQAQEAIAEPSIITASYWIAMLDDTNSEHGIYPNDMYPLDTDLFLDLSGTIASIPPPYIDHGLFVCPLCNSVLKIVRAQNQIEQMVAQQAKQQPMDDCFNSGLVKFNDGNWDGSIADLTAAIELKPDYAYAYNVRGCAKNAKGDLDGSIADYTQAINLSPGYVDAYYNRGIVKETKGDHDGAKADYTKALELKPGYADAQKAIDQMLKQQAKMSPDVTTNTPATAASDKSLNIEGSWSRTSLSLSQLDGDTLRICFDLPGTNRPASFITTSDTQHLFIETYERMSPMP